MKICIFTATYPDNNYEGIFVKNHSELLAKDNNVAVLFSKGIKPALSSNHRNKNNQVTFTKVGDIELYTNCSSRIYASYFVSFTKKSIVRSFNFLFEEYKKNNGMPDIIVCHFSYPAGIGAVNISQKYSIPLICIEHLSLLLKNDILRFRMYSEVRKVMKAANGVVCVSDALRKSIVKKFHIDSPIVIPNPIDPIFEYEKTALDNDCFRFLCVGNLVKIKQIDVLITAFTKTFKDNANVNLTIIGEGKCEKKLKKLIEKNNQINKIHLIGKKNHSELKDYYNNSNCFILLSKKETFGIVYREALLCGCPVISSDNGGINYGWEDSFGKIIKNTSVSSVSNVLKKMYETINEYDREKISESAKRNFSNDSFIKLMNAYIREVYGDYKLEEKK